MTVTGGLECDGCNKFLPQAGVVHSGWIRHEGKDYCLSCQKKKKIGMYAPKQDKATQKDKGVG